MTNKDKLRNDSYTVPARSRVEPLPLSEHARTRHRSIQDIDGLKELIAEHPGRLEQLIRRPFEVEQQETADSTTMRMPPFMRNSNAYPLTLSIWQHQLLMTWLDSVRSKRRLLGRPKQGMSPEAAARRRAVLARLCK